MEDVSRSNSPTPTLAMIGTGEEGEDEILIETEEAEGRTWSC